MCTCCSYEHHCLYQTIHLTYNSFNSSAHAVCTKILSCLYNTIHLKIWQFICCVMLPSGQRPALPLLLSLPANLLVNLHECWFSSINTFTHHLLLLLHTFSYRNHSNVQLSVHGAIWNGTVTYCCSFLLEAITRYTKIAGYVFFHSSIISRFQNK